MTLMNMNQAAILARQVKVADSFFTRLKGLLGTECLPVGQALFIKPCKSVHTFGMRYAIDVIFIDTAYRIVKLIENMPPGKVAAANGAAYVVELPAGTIARTETKVGHKLELSE